MHCDDCVGGWNVCQSVLLQHCKGDVSLQGVIVD